MSTFLQCWKRRTRGDTEAGLKNRASSSQRLWHPVTSSTTMSKPLWVAAVTHVTLHTLRRTETLGESVQSVTKQVQLDASVLPLTLILHVSQISEKNYIYSNVKIKAWRLSETHWHHRGLDAVWHHTYHHIQTTFSSVSFNSVSKFKRFDDRNFTFLITFKLE